MGPLGALGAGLPGIFQERWDWGAVSSYKTVVRVLRSCLASFLCSFTVPSARDAGPRVEKKISRTSGVFVTRMSILEMVDNFGAGMAGSWPPIGFFYASVWNLKLSACSFSLLLLAALSLRRRPSSRGSWRRTHHGLSPTASHHGYLVIPLAPTFSLAGFRSIRLLFASWMIGCEPRYHGHGPIRRKRLRAGVAGSPSSPSASARRSRPI